METTNLKRIRNLIVILALTVTANLQGQYFGVAFGAGGATYKMSDLKYYQEYLLSDFPVEGKMISLFPPYLTGTFTFFRTISDFLKIGVEYNFSSSGSRAYYSDYSGYREASLLAKSHQFGAVMNYKLFSENRIELLAFGSLSASFSTIEIHQAIKVNSLYYGSFFDGYTSNYRSISPSIAVGLEALFHSEKYSFGFDAGYFYDFTANLVNVEMPDYTLTDPKDPDRNLTADWSGFRIRLKMIIWLNKWDPMEE